MSKAMPPLDAVRHRHPRGQSVRQGRNTEELVRRAAGGIAPVWPIATFIARHPWPDLERLSFADAADLLHGTQGIHLYPPSSVVRAAIERGEIAPHHVARRLERWLDRQTLPVPRAQMERLCQALLWDFDPAALPADITDREVLRLAEEAVRHNIAPAPSPRLAVPTISVRLGSPARRLDQCMIRWCKLYLDEGQAVWALPGREAGLYTAWRGLVHVDPSLTKPERKRLSDWPQTPEAGLIRALDHLGVPGEEQEAYLRAHLMALPGWAGMLWWKSQQTGRGTRLLTEYLAVRLSLEWALCAPHLPLANDDAQVGQAAGAGAERAVAPLMAALFRHGGLTPKAWRAMPREEQRAYLAWVRRFLDTDRWHLWLEAWEDTYAATLRTSVNIGKAADGREPAGERKPAGGREPAEKQARLGERTPAGWRKPLAQLLFCIDVRSHTLRRHLETAGPFETYGCAGFFNLPIRTRALDSAYAHPSCPAIVQPQAEVRETLEDASIQAYRRRRNAARLIGHVFKKSKQHLLANLALPELSGPWLGLHTLLRTVAPTATGRWIDRADQAAERKPPTRLSLHRKDQRADAGLPIGMTVEQMVEIAAGLLQSIGLVEFAPLVVVCGHESHTVNNPHASALDCGACGGAAGSFNARAFASLCNLPEVRSGLAREGIAIPDSTVFIAAEHITTTDDLRWLDVPPLPPAAREALDALRRALPEVRRNANAERMAQLPQVRQVADPVGEADRRAIDWSEIRPEWGLAGNAAFIIGRRDLTARAPLGGRAFLHSYDWRLDPDGDRLAAIVAGPVTVAQWINLQYLASTVAPHVHGSGNKATQTVTAGIGVMQGNGSDLLAGLPWQSVAASDDALFHRPLRLLVVIEAPSDTVARLLRRDAAFRRKVQNGWLRLASIDPVTGDWKDWELDLDPAVPQTENASEVHATSLPVDGLQSPAT